MLVKKLILGLHGVKRSGKDTAASFIKEALADDYTITTLSFAEPMRRMLKSMICGCTTISEEMFDAIAQDDRKETFKFPVIGRTYRELMQTLGTEWGRDLVKATLWTDLAESTLQKAEGCVVVTDVRFENEASMIRSNGGHIIHISRFGFQGDTHRSELGIAVNQNDLFLRNDGTLDGLRHRTSVLVRSLASVTTYTLGIC
jgi:hypothetical protein